MNALPNFIFEQSNFLFDPLHYHWEHEQMNQKISVLLVLLFLGSLLVIELKRQGLLPAALAGLHPEKPFLRHPDGIHRGPDPGGGEPDLHPALFLFALGGQAV